ncbi:MAG: polysaccharide deacetylase family protein, partial [Clostridia bacterium]|nr:polysaccharide deacetylase family protein [Clostridia bacterium]
MSSKKWLMMFAITIILALTVCAGMNILVDPFGVFGDPLLNWYSYNETNNPRVAKLAYLEEHHQEYDSYII